MQMLKADEGSVEDSISIVHKLTTQPVDYTDEALQKDVFGAGTYSSVGFQAH